MTFESDGPLGKAPNFSVGASDNVLLVVSGAGFVFLAITVYSIVLTKLKSREEIEEEEKDLNYDERLAAADVSTLNRAQRRARARHIMKQQRRIAPATNAGGENGEDNEEIHPHLPANETHHLSRRERQKAAKAAEREARRLFEDERRQQQQEAQKLAQREKKERERRTRQREEVERKARLEKREAEEIEAYEKWKTFLSSPDGSTVLTVKEWMEELSINRTCRLAMLSKRFRVPQQDVELRIEALLASSRITGICEEGTFTYISLNEMSLLSSWIQTRDVSSLEEIKIKLEEIIKN